MEDRLHLGGHIRKLRKQQHRTLQEVADRSGFSKSLLSKIENGKIVPPVATLVRIAEALGTSASALIEDNRDVGTVCTRAGEIAGSTVQTQNGYRIFPFATQHRHKRMQPFLFVARKGEVIKHHVMHEGEEFLYVLQGEIKFQVGSIEYILREGDSLYFDAMDEHGVMPLTDEARYLDVSV